MKDPEEPHEFVNQGHTACGLCGFHRTDPVHDVDDDEYDPYTEVMRRERERKKLTYTCDECGYSSHDEFLAKSHRCYDGVSEEAEFGGRCEDYPACGHEAGDCFGRKYGSDESIKAFWSDVYSSGMDPRDIADLEDRMDRAEMGY